MSTDEVSISHIKPSVSKDKIISFPIFAFPVPEKCVVSKDKMISFPIFAFPAPEKCVYVNLWIKKESRLKTNHGYR